MPASSLLALLDDIGTILDDVAVLTKTAAMKTTGVMGDDLALNAEQVSGVRVERELPVVWAVARGSFLNKVILVPAALAISAFVPVLIMPLMMIGGLYLCYEGFEKVAHRLLHDPAKDSAHHQLHLESLRRAELDVVAVERQKIKGAIRTDFVLSAEIIVITLGTMGSAPMLQQVLALSAVAIAATVLVYGLVAGIVKLDDLGLRLQRTGGPTGRRLGRMILVAAPRMMKGLSILGTAAMFTVGGGILAHGVPPLAHAIEGVVHGGVGGFIVSTLANAVVGIIAGGIAVGLVALVQRLRGKGTSGGGTPSIPPAPSHT
jgi:uncharacterized protein